MAVAPRARRYEAAEAASLTLGLMRDLHSAGNWHRAERLLESAATLVKRSRDHGLQEELAGLQAAVAGARRVAELEQRLALDPADQEANRLLGGYYCFERDDFARGLPYLARSIVGELREIAMLDLAAPEGPADRRRIGDAWHGWGSKESGLEKYRALSRAKHWYLLATPGLTRFDLVAVEGRLREIDAILDRPSNVVAEEAGLNTATAVLAAVNKLRREHAAYDADMDRLRVEIASALASLEASLAKSERPEDRASLARVRDAIEGLEETGDFPLPPLMPASLQARVDKARAKHRKALERCIRDLSRDDPGDLLEEVEQELDDFELEPAGLYERMSRMPAPDFSLDLGRHRLDNSKWSRDDESLSWKGGKGSKGCIVFGDPDWSDYDVLVTVRVVSEGPKEFSVLAQVGDDGCWALNAGGFHDLSNRDLRAWVDGEDTWKSPSRRWMPNVRPTRLGEVYEFGLRVRKSEVMVLLDGDEVRSSAHQSLRSGRVGIHTWDSSEFLDVEVRDPEGRLLWKGLPPIPK